jgi:hypothetical protein
MQTAMEILIEWIELGEGGWNSNEIIDKATELLETEKQQIIEAHDKGISRYCQWEPERHGNKQPSGTDYFNQTFNK